MLTLTWINDLFHLIYWLFINAVSCADVIWHPFICMRNLDIIIISGVEEIPLSKL